jgi:hypothetical protein
MQSSNHQNITNKNTQDIFLRNAILSILDVLNRRISIDLIDDGKVVKNTIPFFYNKAGTGGFMQDFFIDIPDGCVYPKYAEGDYDIVPNGIITLDNFSIKSSDITNKFVRGTFTQEELDSNSQKILKAYSSRLYTLPMDLKFSAKIKSDNLNKTFKITEKIFDLYYKNEVVYFQYRGIRIPGQIKFPESIGNDKKYQFEYNTDQYVITNFNFDFETYYPSFDDSSTIYKGDNIQNINIDKKIGGTGSSISSGWVDKDFPTIE